MEYQLPENAERNLDDESTHSSTDDQPDLAPLKLAFFIRQMVPAFKQTFLNVTYYSTVDVQTTNLPAGVNE